MLRAFHALGHLAQEANAYGEVTAIHKSASTGAQSPELNNVLINSRNMLLSFTLATRPAIAVTVVDCAGRTIITRRMTLSEGAHRIAISKGWNDSFAAGVYALRISAGDKAIVRPFVRMVNR